jgi:hypothetical protein
VQETGEKVSIWSGDSANGTSPIFDNTDRGEYLLLFMADIEICGFQGVKNGRGYEDEFGALLGRRTAPAGVIISDHRRAA